MSEKAEFRKNQNTTADIATEFVLKIQRPTGFCVEFGAWDGRYLLNSFALLNKFNYAGVLIEPDKRKFRKLCANYKDKKNVQCLNQLVGWFKNDSLDRILAGSACPKRFDFLSIDVDGNDWHIWKAVRVYQPQIVCVEFNPTIPAGVEFVQPADGKIQWGCSVASLLKLGLEKGYRPLHVGLRDVIFGSSDFTRYRGCPSRQANKTSQQLTNHIFIGYDGRILLRGNRNLRWHGIRFYERDLQVLPQFLQKLPDSMNLFEKICLRLFCLLRRWRRSWCRHLGFPWENPYDP